MAPDIESLKNVAPILTPFITALIDTWIKPTGTMIELLNQKRHDVIRKWSSARISSGEARSKNLLI